MLVFLLEELSGGGVVAMPCPGALCCFQYSDAACARWRPVYFFAASDSLQTEESQPFALCSLDLQGNLSSISVLSKQ